MGPGVACECIETKDGPVIWEDHFYPRSSTPKPARCCPDGEDGELVFTPHQGGLPGHPLPHPRPHPPAAADLPVVPPHRQDHRAAPTTC